MPSNSIVAMLLVIGGLKEVYLNLYMWRKPDEETEKSKRRGGGMTRSERHDHQICDDIIMYRDVFRAIDRWLNGSNVILSVRVL